MPVYNVWWDDLTATHKGKRSALLLLHPNVQRYWLEGCRMVFGLEDIRDGYLLCLEGG